MNTYVLSVDVGNTNTHAGLVDLDSLSCIASSTLPTDHLAVHLPPVLALLAGKAAASRTPPVVICTVVNVDRAAVSASLAAAGFAQPSWFEYSDRFPVSVAYDNAGSLGTDRLADCLYGFTAHPGKSQIIIDAGTAITVDFLKHGTSFAGGTILPGIATQLKSLHEHTSALPVVELDETATEFPGTSTRAAMATGVIYGSAGALSFLVARYKEQFGSDAMVLATGGAWKQVEGLVTFEFEYVKDLTLIGTGLFGKRGS
jgi:type III pantothenate kinase